jgi:predicted HTH domain antitoxin
MTNTLPEGLQTLAGAWREFQTLTPVKLQLVEDDQHYRSMVDLLNNLVDEIGDRETHPLVGLLEIVGCFVREYEEFNVNVPDSSGPRTGEDAQLAESDETFAGLDRESGEFAAELRATAAAKWYEAGRVSQEVTVQIAGVSRSEFLTLLSRLQVSPMQESAEDALAGARVLLQP